MCLYRCTVALLCSRQDLVCRFQRRLQRHWAEVSRFARRFVVQFVCASVVIAVACLASHHALHVSDCTFALQYGWTKLILLMPFEDAVSDSGNSTHRSGGTASVYGGDDDEDVGDSGEVLPMNTAVQELKFGMLLDDATSSAGPGVPVSPSFAGTQPTSGQAWDSASDVDVKSIDSGSSVLSASPLPPAPAQGLPPLPAKTSSFRRSGSGIPSPGSSSSLHRKGSQRSKMTTKKVSWKDEPEPAAPQSDAGHSILSSNDGFVSVVDASQLLMSSPGQVLSSEDEAFFNEMTSSRSERLRHGSPQAAAAAAATAKAANPSAVASPRASGASSGAKH